MDSETVVLSPADSSRKFNVHKGLLQHRCNVLYVACTGAFKERLEGYKFDAVTEETLIRFMQWLYTGDYSAESLTRRDPRELDDKIGLAALWLDPLETDKNHSVLVHARVAVFADTYLVDDLKGLATGKIKTDLELIGRPRRASRALLVIKLLDLASSNLHPQDPLLDFLGRYSAWCIKDLRAQPLFQDVVPKMALALVTHLRPLRESPWPPKLLEESQVPEQRSVRGRLTSHGFTRDE